VAAICTAFQKPVGQSGRPPAVLPATLQRRTSQRVLLVEDNPVNQTVARRLLEKHGFSLKVVGNGREAVAATAEEPFDLVLMDIEMPEMDGLDATGAIRERERVHGGHVPIIAMTAHAMKGDQERCLRAGMDAYVTKPIRTAELFAAIETTIGEPARAD